MNPTSAASGFRLRGAHVLAIIVAFFAVVIAVDTTFAVIAMRTFPGQVAKNPYEDGIAFNRKIAQLAAQEKLGWQASAAVGDDGSIVMSFHDRAGAPVGGLKLEARLERPATEAGLLAPAFAETAPGLYRARPGRLAGAYDLTVVARDREGRRFDVARRLTWP